MTSRGKMLQRLGAESYMNQNANDPNNIPSDENVKQKLNLENVDKSTMKLNNALDLPDARTRDENEDTRCKSSENKTSDSSSSSSNSSSGKSSSSTSSSSSGSDSDESSSSEDCDDLYDQTYKPSQEDLNVNSDGDIEIGEDSGNALSTFCPNSTSTSLSSNSNTIQDISTFISPKKSRKRMRDEKKWKRNILKELRNTGKEYEMHKTRKGNPSKRRCERRVKSPCTEKCKLKCSTKFTEEDRQFFFNNYWNLGDLEKQRQFLSNCMTVIEPKYRYVREGGKRGPRNKNNAYYLILKGEKTRVCKLFFERTLDINSRNIRTVVSKRNEAYGPVLERDHRGKHNKHQRLDSALIEGMKDHINLIPRMESHYLRAQKSREFIDGSKTIADIHRDYVSNCKETGKPYASYATFAKIFNEEFNISFFSPKKDLCELCARYEISSADEKTSLQVTYDTHLIEKQLSREQKERDKQEFDGILAVYDLQVVLQLPKSNASLFYYKRKLNVYNFTIYGIQDKYCESYVWEESNGKRGVNELGSCILNFFKKKTQKNENSEVIFYSDNCAGQQKNKFMLAVYLYLSQ